MTTQSHDGSHAGRETGPQVRSSEYARGAGGGYTRGVGSLLGELLNELRALARNEVQLARTEMSERIHRAQSGAGGLGAAAVISIAGLVVLLQSATLGLNVWLQRGWLSALIVGGVTVLIGAIFAAWGRSRLRAESLAPRKSAESLQRDADLLRHEGERHFSTGHTATGHTATGQTATGQTTSSMQEETRR
jgi:uncharacterized membrane protein YcjF (UPF0283 family)